MRQLALIPLLVAAAACDAGGGTRPDVGVIQVRVVDDRGAPVNRAEVTVRRSSVSRVDAKTGNDGIARIGVADAGTYEVTVIPRAGYLSGPDGSSRRVDVASSSSAAVEFKLYREGSAPTYPQQTPLP